MSTPRKHHYLPRFYLRGFSPNARSLTQIEKETGRAVVCSINDVASIRDYHRLDSDEISDQYELERRLGSIEGELATATRHAIQNGVDSAESRARIAELFSMLRTRVPAMKSMIEESLRQVVRSTGLIAERGGRLPPPPPGLEEFLRMDSIGIEISNWACLQYMFLLAGDEDILRLLVSMRPTVVRAPSGHSFITSDQPVAVFSPSASLSDLEGVGLAEPDVQLSLPLSSDTLIQLDWSEGDPQSIAASPQLVEEFNRRTTIMATNYVFAPNEEAARGLVHRFGKFSAGMQPPQTLDAGDSFFHLLSFLPVVSPEQYELDA